MSQAGSVHVEAAVSHHNHTPYDELLVRGVDRADARHQIADKVEEVLSKWRRQGVPARIIRLRLRGAPNCNCYLTPGGNPPAPARCNSHEINETLGRFAFRTMNDTCCWQKRQKVLPAKMFIMINISVVEAAGVGLPPPHQST